MIWKLVALVAALSLFSTAPGVAAISIHAQPPSSPKHDVLARALGARQSTVNRLRCRALDSARAADAPAPSSAPAPQPAAPLPGGQGKMLVAWANAARDSELYKVMRGEVFAYYDWNPRPVYGSDHQFFPMVWGDKDIELAHQLIPTLPRTLILFLNEPDQPGQANMSPEHAAQLYRAHIAQYAAQGWPIVAPAVTNSPAGREWLRQFFAICGDCSFAGVAAHFYGTSAQALIDFANGFISEFGRPLYITEAACQSFDYSQPQCSRDQVFQFAREVRDYVNSNSMILAFAPFGPLHDMANVNPDNRLISADGELNELGRLYFNA